MSLTVDTVILSCGSEGQETRRSVSLEVNRVGKTTREGVRVEATSSGNSVTLLVCREPPSQLRPGISYCPLSLQKSERTRSVFESLLPQKPSAAVSADSEGFEESEDDGKQLKRRVGELRRVPLTISRPIDTYPKLVALVKRLQRLESEFGFSWKNLVSAPSRLHELMQQLGNVEAWESVAREAETLQALAALEAAIRQELPVKFLKSFPGFMNIRRERKLRQRAPARSSEAAQVWTRQWIAFLRGESKSAPSGFPIRGGRAVQFHWLSGVKTPTGALSLHASAQLGESASGQILPLSSGDVPLPAGPQSFYVLFFLARIPATLLVNHPVFPLLRFLLPFIDGELSVEHRRSILGVGPNDESQSFAGVEMEIGSVGKNDLKQFIANLVLRLAESQTSVADQLSPVQSAALLRYLHSAGAPELRRAVSIRSLPARAVVAKSEKSILALVNEAATEAIESHAVRVVHLRLAAIQRWKAQVRLNGENLNFSSWKQTLDTELLVACLRRWETIVLRCLYSTPPELLRSAERVLAIKQLQSIRWMIVSHELQASSLPLLVDCQYHLSHLPVDSLGATAIFSALTSRVGKCEKILDSMVHRFESRDELEDFSILRDVASFDVSKSEPVIRAGRLLVKLNDFSRRVTSGQFDSSLGSVFRELEEFMAVSEPERSLWLSFDWQQRVNAVLSAKERDHSVVTSLLAEQRQLSLNPGDINVGELQDWAAHVSGILQSIESSGDFSLLDNLGCATSQEIQTIFDFRDSLFAIAQRVQSLHIPRLDDLLAIRNDLEGLLHKWPGSTTPQLLGSMRTDIHERCASAESLEADALAALANPKAVEITAAVRLLDKCKSRHTSEAVDKLSAQVELDLALASQAQSGELASYRSLIDAVRGLTELSGFKQDPALISTLRDSLWVTSVALMARWAAASRLVAPGPPWLLLLELKSITPANPPAECVAWLTKALQTSERMLKEVKPLPTDVLTGTGIPDRLGKWLRLRLLLPLYPIGLGEPMEQMRGLLEQKFPGYRLSCGYIPGSGAAHQRRLESTSVTLPGGRPGAKVSTRPGRSMLELLDSDKLSTAFKQKVAGAAAPVTAESVAAKALKQASKIPGLMKEITELTGRTVTTAAEVFADADFSLGFEGSSEEWFRLSAVSGFDASLTCGFEEATRIEEIMLLEIPCVSRSDHAAYLDRFIRTLLHIQTTGNADRILARQRQAPLTAHIEAAPPAPLPVIAEPPKKQKIDNLLWSGVIEGSVKGSAFSLNAALLPLFSPETAPPAIEPGNPWRFDGSMSQGKFTEFFAKLEASGKRSLFNVIVCVHDWTVAPSLFSSLLGADPYVSAFVMPGTKLPKLWLLPPEPGASFVCGILETMLIPGTPVRNIFGEALSGWVTELEIAANAGSIPGVSTVFTDIPQPEEAESPVSLESEAGEAPAETQAMVDIMMQLHRQLASQSNAPVPVAPAIPAVPVRSTSEFELSAASLREALRSRSGTSQTQQSLPQALQQALLQPPQPVQTQQPYQQQYQQQYQQFQQNQPIQHQPSSSGLPGVLSFFSTPGMQTGSYSTDSTNAPVCKFFNMGTCNKGTSCRFSHVCNICRGAHNAFEHDRVYASQAAPQQGPRMSWRNL